MAAHTVAFIAVEVVAESALGEADGLAPPSMRGLALGAMGAFTLGGLRQ